MDRIWVYGIACRVRLGVPRRERSKPQGILIDVGMELDLTPAAASDDFRATVDYQAVEKAVRAAAQAGERQLAETLAEEIASLVLGLNGIIAAVNITVHKKPAVMPKTREIAVQIRRQRPILQ